MISESNPNAALISCAWALDHAHAFLRGEVDESEAELIRQHLGACEECLDDFDVQAALTSLIQRCYPSVQATSVLRTRVTAMRVVISRQD